MLTCYLSLLENERDRDKLEYLYTAYYPLMIAVAMRQLHELAAAQDVVHQSILKIIRNLDHINEKDPLATEGYLCATVRHLAIDVQRKEARIENADMDELPTAQEEAKASPMEAVLSSDGYEYLLTCIDSLNDTYRTVCQLKYVGGLTEAEIASLLDLPVKTVDSRIFRARQILQKKIREDGYYEK